jgi:hypothetical protein
MKSETITRIKNTAMASFHLIATAGWICIGVLVYRLPVEGADHLAAILGTLGCIYTAADQANKGSKFISNEYF